MRFLLYPRPTTAGAAIKKVKTEVIEAVTGTVSKTSTTTFNGTVSKITNTTGHVRENNQNSSNHTPVQPILKQFWGQQCNENCGCVVRFEATIDTTTSNLLSIDYTAKKVLTTTTTTTTKRTNLSQQTQTQQEQEQEQLHQIQRKNGGHRVVARTLKGRPMISECTCSTVHTISKEIINYIKDNNMNWIQLYTNICNFENIRSSLSFQQSVLLSQKLSIKDGHCFDVVEEALTGMIKGYIPQSRQYQIPNQILFQFQKQQQQQIQQQQQQHVQHQITYQYNNHNNKEEFYKRRNHTSLPNSLDNYHDYHDDDDDDDANTHPNEKQYRPYQAFPKMRNTIATTFDGSSSSSSSSSSDSILPWMLWSFPWAAALMERFSSSFGTSATNHGNPIRNKDDDSDDDDYSNKHTITTSSNKRSEINYNNQSSDFPERLTTLKMYDMALLGKDYDDEEEDEEEDEDIAATSTNKSNYNKMKIVDWVSYVDHQYSSYFNYNNNNNNYNNQKRSTNKNKGGSEYGS